MLTRCEEDAYISIAHQLPELVNQLKLMNALKVWELKYNHREFGPSQTNGKEIDKIVEQFNY